MATETNWKDVSDFLNGVIEEANDPTLKEDSTRLEVHIYSKAFNETMKVIVPSNRVKDFMKRLALWEAEVYEGRPKKPEFK